MTSQDAGVTGDVYVESPGGGSVLPLGAREATGRGIFSTETAAHR